MKTIVEILTEVVAAGFEAAGYDDLPNRVDPVVASKKAGSGDYQSNACFRMAKAFKTSPRSLAEAVVGSMPPSEAIESAEVAGPGFINLSLSNVWLGRRLAQHAADSSLGMPQSDGVVVIDYSSPNVAKRMHVAHLRSTVIGNALDRMLRFAGNRVIADNHIGDWGTQFGKLIVAWRKWVDLDAFEKDPIGELQRIYVHFAREAELSPELEEQARNETAALQAGNKDNNALWQKFIQVSMVEFNSLYERLGVKFDVTLGESFYNPSLGSIVDDLLESGVAERSDGAVIVPFTAEDGKALKDTPMLVQKSDGAALYATTDLATVKHRLSEWSPTQILYVTDTRQQLHFKQLFAACNKIGWADTEFVHVWFGLLSLPGGAMSTRKGNVINLKDLLDEAARRARAVVDAKAPDLSEKERAEIAEAVGVGAVRYADLSQNPQSNVVFDWDKMLALDGNTAPYLMYTYARCRSIQRKGGVEAPIVDGSPPVEPHERDLAVALLRFPEAVGLAINNSRPNMLCDYLYSLASVFNRFYYEMPVLKANDDVKNRRLSLVEATAQVMGQGLGLLGVKTLERM
jgi:arginyl-tRNA synthetase